MMKPARNQHRSGGVAEAQPRRQTTCWHHL